MTSTIHADKIMNSSGDQDSGVDLLVNDQVKLKTANTDRVTVTDATTTVANALAVTGNQTITGTTTQNNKLTVLASDGTADNDWVMEVRNDEQTNDRSWGLKVSAGSTVTDTALDVRDHTGASNFLKVDGAGNVTKPKQPMLYTHRSSTRISVGNGFAINTQHTIPWASPQIDVGNNFSSNVFTCPVAGKYKVDVMDMAWSSNAGYIQINVQKNSSQMAIFYWDASGYGTVVGGSLIIDAAANDTIKARCYFTGSGAYMHESSYGSLGIYLIG